MARLGAGGHFLGELPFEGQVLDEVNHEQEDAEQVAHGPQEVIGDFVVLDVFFSQEDEVEQAGAQEVHTLPQLSVLDDDLDGLVFACELLYALLDFQSQNHVVGLVDELTQSVLSITKPDVAV